MNTYLTKKRLLPTLALACLALLVSQNAQASATFSSYATVTYTIESLNNSANPGNFSGLGITGSFGLVPGQDISTITGEGTVTLSLTGAGSTSLTPEVGSNYSRTFQLDGAANNGGKVEANYLAWFGLSFENVPTDTGSADSYDIGLTLTYELSANASGDNAFTDITLNYFNENGSFSGSDYLNATSEALNPAPWLVTLPRFDFTLTPGESEKLFEEAGITSTLQASPVPVPSAIWLFVSALLAMPGIKKSNRAV